MAFGAHHLCAAKASVMAGCACLLPRERIKG